MFNTYARISQERREIMKRIFAVVLLLVFMIQLCYAENFIGMKMGKTQYTEEKDSVYPGSHVYEGNETYGVILGYKKNSWITRLDIEKFRTGSEFSHDFPIAYDGVKINQYLIILSFGRQIDMFYGLLGAGYIVNDAEFWEYTSTPFDAKMNNSPCLALTLGIEKNVAKDIYVFVEGQYTYSKTKVETQGYNSFTEDVSNVTGWTGLGWRF